jgi:hypothetical protein
LRGGGSTALSCCSTSGRVQHLSAVFREEVLPHLPGISDDKVALANKALHAVSHAPHDEDSDEDLLSGFGGHQPPRPLGLHTRSIHTCLG